MTNARKVLAAHYTATWEAGKDNAPKMTRSHFKYLACLMAEIRPTMTHAEEYRQWEHTVNSLAIALTWTNDNFDKGAFTAACGMD